MEIDTARDSDTDTMSNGNSQSQSNCCASLKTFALQLDFTRKSNRIELKPFHISVLRPIWCVTRASIQLSIIRSTAISCWG